MSKFQSIRAFASYIIAFIMLSATLSCSPPPESNTYIAEKPSVLADTNLTALYVPIDRVSLTLADNPSQAPVSDAFFVEMANALAQYELSKHYKSLMIADSIRPGMAGSCPLPRPENSFSELADHSIPSNTVGGFVRTAAARCSVDLIIFPYSCELKGSSFRPKGWRNDKYGKHYGRPVSFTTQALFHLQIWDKNGKLVFERKGRGYGSKPVFRNPRGKKGEASSSTFDIKNMVVPPLINALTEAARDAFIFR